jgi:hypothetical protein
MTKPLSGILLSTALALPTLILGGCAGGSHGAIRIANEESIELGSRDARGAWPHWPTSIRILPLTKVARPAATGATTGAATGAATDTATEAAGNATPAAVPIEIRIEALDDAGTSTRAVGTFVITVASSGAEPASQRWKFDCATASAHAIRYDPVTDTYRFIVTPEWTTAPAVGSTIDLTVVLYGADGAMPSATAALRW